MAEELQTEADRRLDRLPHSRIISSIHARSSPVEHDGYAVE